MALPLEPAAATPKAPPCARCGNPSDCAIWDHRVCHPCAGRWAERADATPELGGLGDKSAAYRTFTAAWLAEAKRGAA